MANSASFENGKNDQIDLEIENQLRLLVQKKNSKNSIAILILSVLVFINLGLFRNSFVNILILVAVLFIHELGHLFAMRLFKYRDTSMLFIPFMGAITSGEEITPSSSHRAIVALLGPLPGIIIGVVLGIVYLKMGQEILIQSSRIFLFINAFNLLPIFPLDGGQFANAVFFSRNRNVELGFQIAMVIILSALSFLMKWPLLSILALMVFFSLFGTFLSSSIAQTIKEDIPEGQALSQIPTLSYIKQIREELVRKETFRKLSPKALAVHVQNIWRRVCNQPPKWRATFGLSFVYLLSLIVGLFSYLIIEGISAGYYK